jgi:hypothetical protein
MAANEQPPLGSPTRSDPSSLSQTLSNSSQEYNEKEKLELQDTLEEPDIAGPSLVSDDVAIPAGILRAANRAHNRKSYVEDEEKTFPRQSGIPEDFSIQDIAWEQRQHAEEGLNFDSTGRADTDHHAGSEVANHRVSWATHNLPTLEEGTQLGQVAAPRRWSSRRLAPSRTLSSHNDQRDVTALPAVNPFDTVLYRTISGATLQNEPRTGRRPLSESIAPDADYIGVYEDSHALDANQPTTDLWPTTTNTTVDPNDNHTQNARKATLARLCMRGRNDSSAGPAMQPAKQGAAGLARRNSLLDVYDKAKIRGQQLQRKKWVQWTFEGTCYLLILCFIYFVLVGRPIWNGAVWWLYWVVNNKFTVAGTWSVTIGMALLYVLFEILGLRIANCLQLRLRASSDHVRKGTANAN